MNDSLKDKQEVAFDNWVDLLKSAKAEEKFLNDPKAIWLEAWTQATMIAWNIVEDNVPSTKYKEKVQLELKLRLLK